MFGFSQKDQDPVCRMKVDKNKSKFSSKHKGKTYYFCSENCKNQFKSDPEIYL